MIAHIQGRVDYKGSNYVVVEAGGVGYKFLLLLILKVSCPIPERRLNFAPVFK